MLPTFDELRNRACEQLAQAVQDPKHPFRWPVFATVDADGRPAVRTVILREFTREPGLLVFFTDRRSPKLGQLRRQPASSWLFYDPAQRLQVRIDGQTHLVDDESRRRYFERALNSLRDYTGPVAPSAVIPEPRAAEAPELSEADGWQNFAALETRIETLELLLLRREGHLRARFRWRLPSAEWLAP